MYFLQIVTLTMNFQFEMSSTKVDSAVSVHQHYFETEMSENDLEPEKSNESVESLI